MCSRMEVRGFLLGKMAIVLRQSWAIAITPPKPADSCVLYMVSPVQGYGMT